jgi:Asp-tRNA(Asn)/Glu-tRNA(Gln) amidotransferase A subunit family amidase
MSDVHPMDMLLHELISAIQSGKITPLQSVQASIDRIQTLNPKINAFVLVGAEKVPVCY